MLIMPPATSAPAGHERFHTDHLGGTIVVAGFASDAIWLDRPTPDRVRKRLRAAYRAVTPARYAEFVGHDRELASRPIAFEEAGLIPCRVQGQGELRQLVLLPGTLTPAELRAGLGTIRPAARLPSRRHDRLAPGDPDGRFPADGAEVECWIEQIDHHCWSPAARLHRREPFSTWRARAIAPVGRLERLPQAAADPGPQAGRPYARPTGRMRRIRGWVAWAEQAADPDDRVFFADGSAPTLPLDAQRLRSWRTQFGAGGGEDSLIEGMLGWARVCPVGMTWSVQVLIAHTPTGSAIGPRLPAFSPADRLFGSWGTNDDHLRVAPLRWFEDRFECTIGLRYLAREELGALLWLLTEDCERLRLVLRDDDLHDSSSRRDDLLDLLQVLPSTFDVQGTVAAFRRAVARVIRNPDGPPQVKT